MAEDLTFAKPPSKEAWHPEVSFHQVANFYSATGTDTHPVYRFVGPSVHGTAATAAGQFSAVSGAGAAIAGYLAPHVHDDKDKEYFADVAVGEEATIVRSSAKPVIVEAGAGITAGELAPMTQLQTDADGKAIAAASGDKVVALGVEAFAVDGVTYVRALLVLGGDVVA